METWKIAERFGIVFEVSSAGLVRPIVKNITTGRWGAYFHVGFWVDGVSRSVYLHHVVAEAFLGPCPGKIGRRRGDWQVNHINLNKLDNRIENLEWISQAENLRHARRNGAHPPRGLGKDAVAEIRRRLSAGETQDSIAKIYRTTQPVISNVKHGKGCYAVPA